MNDIYEKSQDIWMCIKPLAELVATPGVSEENLKNANDKILTLLRSLDPIITRVSASSVGIITT